MKNDVQKYVDKYDDVRGQVDRITNELEQHKTRLLTDIVRLDKLYDANLGISGCSKSISPPGVPS